MISTEYSPTQPNNEKSFFTPELSIMGVTPANFKNISNFIGKAGGDIIGNNVKTQFNEIGEKISSGNKFLKPYFAVSNQSIIHRIKNLIFPFYVGDWSRFVDKDQPYLPTSNPNISEMYTPLLFSFLFILIKSIIDSIRGNYSFEAVSISTFKFMFSIIAEVVITKIILFSIGFEQTHSPLTLLADFGCISFYLSLISLFSWNSFMRNIALIYSCAGSLLWYLRTLYSEPCISSRQTKPSKLQTYSFIILSLFQSIMLFLFSPSSPTSK